MVQGVILNLVIDTCETRILGAENHVCELQLVLDDILRDQVLASSKAGSGLNQSRFWPHSE